MTADARRLSQLIPGASLAGRVLVARGAVGAVAWMSAHRQRVLAAVRSEGWALVRGLDVREDPAFRVCIEALGFPVAFDYGDLPLSVAPGADGVFEVTPFPPEEAILFHHEGAHTPRAPRYICFHCSVPAQAGGETPMADSTEMLVHLPRAIRDSLAERGLRYRRSFVEGLDVPWQRFFGLTDPREVEARCDAQGIDARWQPDGRLCIETRRPAIVAHPETGRPTFFNQILLHHPACLDPEVREAFQLVLPAGETPRDVRFGDDSPIPDEWIDEILSAYLRVAITFAWQAGDIVVADNSAVAHSRRPYVGPRRHRVVMSRC